MITFLFYGKMWLKLPHLATFSLSYFILANLHSVADIS